MLIEQFHAEKEKLVLENTLLRAKINPHFLYNTLNFLYAKALPLSGTLSEGIMKLADIMRYSLKDKEPDGLVSLNEELEHVENLIELARLRFNNKLALQTRFDAFDDTVRIAPLVFITLVENIFKHGMLSDESQTATVTLEKLDKQWMRFYDEQCQASCGPQSVARASGLTNTRARLKDIYGEGFEISVKDSDIYFEVSVTLPVIATRAMSMIECAILDDEEHALEVLTLHVAACDQLKLLIATTNAVEVLNLAAAGSIQLLFLDINMPEISGLDVAKSIGGACKIIFTTAYPEYAMDGYDLGVVDYLLKPISYPRFLKAVQKALSSMHQTKDPAGDEPQYIFVKAGVKSSVVKISLDEIVYVEGLQNYVGIYHGGKKTLAYLNLKDVEAALPDDRFMRVHKSFIVSLRHITKIEAGEIELQGIKEPVAIGESYKAKLWQMVREHTLGKAFE